MKNYFLSGIAAFMLFACNDSDTATVVQVSARSLKTITVNSGSTTDVYDFTNDKVTRQSVYSGQTLNYYYDYTYTQDGQLSGVTGKDSQGQAIFERALTYDASGRLTVKNDSYYNPLQGTTSTEDVVFTYDDANHTISADYTDSPSFEWSPDRVYYFNPRGLLTKITVDGNIVQDYAYEGNNITQMANVAYSYDTATEVKGAYLNRYRNQFSSYANFVVFNGYMVPSTVTDRFMAQMDENPGTAGDATFTYEFDDDGYPTAVHQVTTGSNDIDMVITYN